METLSQYARPAAIIIIFSSLHHYSNIDIQWTPISFLYQNVFATSAYTIFPERARTTFSHVFESSH